MALGAGERVGGGVRAPLGAVGAVAHQRLELLGRRERSARVVGSERPRRRRSGLRLGRHRPLTSRRCSSRDDKVQRRAADSCLGLRQLEGDLTKFFAAAVGRRRRRRHRPVALAEAGASASRRSYGFIQIYKGAAVRTALRATRSATSSRPGFVSRTRPRLHLRRHLRERPVRAPLRRHQRRGGALAVRAEVGEHAAPRLPLLVDVVRAVAARAGAEQARAPRRARAS